MTMRKFCVCVVLTSTLNLASITPALADDLADAVRKCARLGSDAIRLACYDRAAIGGAAAGTADKPAAPTPFTLTPEENFGLRGALADKVRKQHGQEKELALASLDARVVDISRQPHGELVLTLHNGQVWIQSQVSPHFIVKIGDTVTIKQAALGSFVLSNTSGRATRVARMQ